jgi:hypothetical protein
MYTGSGGLGVGRPAGDRQPQALLKRAALHRCRREAGDERVAGADAADPLDGRRAGPPGCRRSRDADRPARAERDDDAMRMPPSTRSVAAATTPSGTESCLPTSRCISLRFGVMTVGLAGINGAGEQFIARVEDHGSS